MIKVRLHGTKEEIESAKTLYTRLEQEGLIEILTMSDLYADRGVSKYYRVYMDMEIKRLVV